MRNYDLTLIFSPLLASEEANDLFQQFVSFVQEQGGILEDQRLLGKRPLLAPIRGSKEGYLASVAFAVNKEGLPALEKRCKESGQILRFFVARQTKKAKSKRTVPSAPSLGGPALMRPAPALTDTTDRGQEEKVDLKDIDEKLEEIFKEA